MKVKELIEELSKFDSESLVVKEGHSDGDGYNSINRLIIISILPQYPDGGWRGDFRPCKDDSPQAIKAVYMI